MTSKMLIVSFAGNGLRYGGIPKVEFGNFLNRHFSHIDAQFYIDYSCKSYHFGMEGISTNIDDTVQALKEKFEGYDRVICLGASAGGYAAILFGSLLNVDSVIAFIPQTVLKSTNRDERYRNLQTVINTTTKYYIIGDESISDTNNYHHISQCENISMFHNVFLRRMNGVDLHALRYSGQLFNMVNNIIQHNDDMFMSSTKAVAYHKELSLISSKFHHLRRCLPLRFNR